MVAPQFPLAEFRVDPMSGCQAVRPTEFPGKHPVSAGKAALI